MRLHERMTFRHDDAAEENYGEVCLRTRDHRIRGEMPSFGMFFFYLFIEIHNLSNLDIW